MGSFGEKPKTYTGVLPAAVVIDIFISEGLLQPINASKLADCVNLSADFVSPPWDENNTYTIPYQWGTTSFIVSTDVYSDDINTYDVPVNPADEIQRRIGMLRSPEEVILIAQNALGLPLCNETPKTRRKCRICCKTRSRIRKPIIPMAYAND